MTGLTRDGTAEPVSRDQILKRERGQGKNGFLPCSAGHEQGQQSPVDPHSAESAGRTVVVVFVYLTLLTDPLRIIKP